VQPGSDIQVHLRSDNVDPVEKLTSRGQPEAIAALGVASLLGDLERLECLTGLRARRTRRAFSCAGLVQDHLFLVMFDLHGIDEFARLLAPVRLQDGRDLGQVLLKEPCPAL
jgi:hypothetical protein